MRTQTQRTKQKLDLTSISNKILINKNINYSLNKLDNSLNSGTRIFKQAKGNSICGISGINKFITPIPKLNLRTPKSAVRQ